MVRATDLDRAHSYVAVGIGLGTASTLATTREGPEPIPVGLSVQNRYVIPELVGGPSADGAPAG